MGEYAETYRAVRRRVAELVRDLDEEALATPVPACPGWTVHDVVAHLAGTTVDVAHGNLEGVGTDAWTAAQVERGRQQSIGELLDDWEANAATLEGGLDSLPFEMAAGPSIGDAWSHEYDIRVALGVPPADDEDAAARTFSYYVRQLGGRLASGERPALRLRAGGENVVAGEGEPAATVTADLSDLNRALTGRRTEEQILGFDWDGYPAPFVDVLSSYGSMDRAID